MDEWRERERKRKQVKKKDWEIPSKRTNSITDSISIDEHSYVYIVNGFLCAICVFNSIDVVKQFLAYIQVKNNRHINETEHEE